MGETPRKQKTSQKESSKSAAKKKAPLGLLAASWLVPGLGHWILGRKKRAIVFGVVIVCAFITGVLVDGELGTPKPKNPFSWLAAFACLGNGILYLGRILWLNGFTDLLAGIPFALQGGGNPSAAGFAYGNTFLYTAGLMNLLTVLDVSDIARGEKE